MWLSKMVRLEGSLAQERKTEAVFALSGITMQDAIQIDHSCDSKCHMRCTSKYLFLLTMCKHWTEVEAITKKLFTGCQHLYSLLEQNKSALTDYASHDNNMINWPALITLDRESDKYQMDQGSGTHLKGGMAFYEGQGQLHSGPQI